MDDLIKLEDKIHINGIYYQLIPNYNFECGTNCKVFQAEYRSCKMKKFYIKKDDVIKEVQEGIMCQLHSDYILKAIKDPKEIIIAYVDKSIPKIETFDNTEDIKDYFYME